MKRQLLWIWTRKGIPGVPQVYLFKKHIYIYSTWIYKDWYGLLPGHLRYVCEELQIKPPKTGYNFPVINCNHDQDRVNIPTVMTQVAEHPNTSQLTKIPSCKTADDSYIWENTPAGKPKQALQRKNGPQEKVRRIQCRPLNIWYFFGIVTCRNHWQCSNPLYKWRFLAGKIIFIAEDFPANHGWLEKAKRSIMMSITKNWIIWYIIVLIKWSIFLDQYTSYSINFPPIRATALPIPYAPWCWNIHL
jgi:hypothetical protein